jgi:hypothetical protein
MYLEKTLYLYVKLLMIVTIYNVALNNWNNDWNPLLWVVRTPKNLKLWYIVIGLITIWVAFKRETYLPFLGECVLPQTVLKSGSNVVGDKMVEVDVAAPGVDQIVWWASKPSDSPTPNPDVWKAYDDYMNSGVVNVVNGVAKISFLCPQEYTVQKTFMKKHLKKHIHFREVGKNGMLGAIKTVYVDC